MSEEGRQDPAWVYWKARAMLANAQDRYRARPGAAIAGTIASPRGFYEQLALEELGQQDHGAARPAPLTEAEKEARG
jgi:soluble lytic murein transglycosylase